MAELDVRAVTLFPGNVVAAQGLDNALRIIWFANRCGILVAARAQHPRFQKLVTAEFWHGQNGLANIQLPPSQYQVDSRFAPDRILQLIHRSPHKITQVPVGPLINIARAAERDSTIGPLVKEVIILGGGPGSLNAKFCVPREFRACEAGRFYVSRCPSGQKEKADVHA